MIHLTGMLEFVTRLQGSVIPSASKVALPATVLAAFLKLVENTLPVMEDFGTYFKVHDSAFSAFSGLLGFLIVFRSSQAYNRYWNGGCLVQQMLGSWFDCASSVVAFTRMTKGTPKQVEEFRNKVIKLFSILTALCLARLEEGSQEEHEMSEEELSIRLSKLELTGNADLDTETMNHLKSTPLKIETVFHWIQGLIVDGISSGILGVPPPIASRAFQELGGGLVKFEDCMKICILPIPFPYSQTTVVLLIIHYCITPFTMCSYTESILLAGLYTFTIVFTFWSLFFISMELENPFGEDENDLDVLEIQRSMNNRLMSLLASSASHLPDLDWYDGKAATPRRGELSRSITNTLGTVCDVRFVEVDSSEPGFFQKSSQYELLPQPGALALDVVPPAPSGAGVELQASGLQAPASQGTSRAQSSDPLLPRQAAAPAAPAPTLSAPAPVAPAPAVPSPTAPTPAAPAATAEAVSGAAGGGGAQEASGDGGGKPAEPGRGSSSWWGSRRAPAASESGGGIATSRSFSGPYESAADGGGLRAATDGSAKPAAKVRSFHMDDGTGSAVVLR